MAATVLARVLADEAATTRLGADLALALRPGDCLALSGDLGAGKSTLARGLIRAIAGDFSLDVPSPTFTLVQSYDGRLPISHLDLYRLNDASELDELGLDEALESGAAVIEWPEKAEGRLPPSAVWIELSQEGEGRRATFSGDGALLERIKRSLAIRDFLDDAGFPDADRAYFIGDASPRSYETISQPGQPDRILMNAPPLVLGPPVRDGKAYAEIAHTARSVAAFVAIDRALSAHGVSVPEIPAADLDGGFLLLSHLGLGSFLNADGQPVRERYAAAAELLAMIHGKHWDAEMLAAPGVVHPVPPFDRDALLIEVELLVEWYVPWKTGKPASPEQRTAFSDGWNAVLDRLEHAEKSIVLRDFHSPNIVWRGEKTGLDRLGIVDFQDALIGPSAYDVASLAMDARVTVPPAIEQATVEAYVAARQAAGGFDETGFREAYAIMAAQRNSKILGIFVRLDKRDGKPAYLRHLPRIQDYLARAFTHPALAPLAALYHDNGFLGDGA